MQKMLVLIFASVFFSHLSNAQLWNDPTNVGGEFIDGFAIDSTGTAWAAGFSDVYILPPGGSWTEWLTSSFPNAIHSTGSTIYVAGVGGLYAIENLIWNEVLPDVALFSVWALEDRIVVGGYHGQVFESTDKGASWVTLNPDPLYQSDDAIRSIAANPIGIVYGEIGPSFTRDLYSNEHSVWSKQSPASYSVIEEGGAFFATANNKIFTSTDGHSWTEYASTPSSSSIGALAKRGKMIAVFNGAGILFSPDEGANWADISAGLFDQADIDFLAFGPSNHLWAISDSLVQKSLIALSPTSGTPIELVEDSTFELGIDDLFPNPATKRVQLDLVSPGGEIKVEVYDILGRRVTTLHQGFVLPGRMKLIWDADQASGNYFIVATTSSHRSSKPVVIQR